MVSEGPDRRIQLDELKRRIGGFVQTWGAEGSFEELALELFDYQFQANLPYRRFCESRGTVPDTVSSWDAVPAVPTEAFRTQKLSCVPDLEPASEPAALASAAPCAVFQTSGTTSDSGAPAGTHAQRGRHWMDEASLSLYRLSLRTGFARLAKRASQLPVRALLAPFSKSPQSSLSFMVSTLAEDSGQPYQFFWTGDGPDLARATVELRKEEGPVLLFTTAFGLLELLERLSSPLPLPPGSMVIETGGFKGRRRAVEREELYQQASRLFKIPASNIGSEYGMCEMASQFYDESLGTGNRGPGGGLLLPVKVGPPWVRSLLIDPDTAEPARPGKPKILRHFDLCNLNSVMALQTADMALPAGHPAEPDVLVEHGARVPASCPAGFILRGRLPKAVPRGCSLSVEEWMDRSPAEESDHAP